MKRGIIYLVVTGLLVSSAAEANERLRERTLRLSERVTNMISRNINVLSEVELREVNQRLLEIGQIVRGQEPVPDPGRPPRRPDGDLFEAVCHIDDDAEFTHGQSVVGTLRGDTVEDIAMDCQSIARSTYGAVSSSGLLNLTPDMARLPLNYQTAECHIDDDSEFTAGQLVVGTVAGWSVTDLLRECGVVANTSYTNGSSGLVNLNAGRQAPRGLKVATCEIDDDPDFTPGQIVVGTIWGQSITDLTLGCQEIAKSSFGSRGSSGIKDLR